ncbi:MAG: DUF2752 domain-containing protein [Bacillota bacterium]
MLRNCIFVEQRVLRITLILLAGCGCVAGAYLLYVATPGVSAVYVPCFFKSLTGLYCPGCGSGRAVHALLHGDIVAAIRSNPLFVVSLPVLLYLLASFVLNFVGVAQLPELFSTSRRIWLMFWIVVIFTILRNMPYEPFMLLAPR